MQYDQARDLVATVAEIGQSSIVLFLDQWEKSPDPGLEAKTLDAFLHHFGDWPTCHVFVALRPDEPAFGTVERLVASRPGPAEIYRLNQMVLEERGERKHLVHFIQREVPAAADVKADALLKLIDGYPGVLYQWNSDYQRAQMKSFDDLAFI